jgi:hypothetical protein
LTPWSTGSSIAYYRFLEGVDVDIAREVEFVDKIPVWEGRLAGDMQE